MGNPRARYTLEYKIGAPSQAACRRARLLTP